MSMFKHNPHNKCRTTSPFGMRINPVNKVKKMHNGIDIGAITPGKEGDPLHAVADGVVEISKIDGAGLHAGYGYYIRINHGAFKTLYGHIQKLEVKVGQQVKAGQIVAHMGNTGSSTAAHLHFGLMQGGAWVDPNPHLLIAQEKEEEEMSRKKFDEMMDRYIDERAARPVSAWAKSAWENAVKSKMVDGTAPRGFVTREQLMVILEKM